MDIDKRKSLYDALSSVYDLGDYESFERNLNDPVKRKSLYDAAIGQFDLGNYESFERNVLPAQSNSSSEVRSSVNRPTLREMVEPKATSVMPNFPTSELDVEASRHPFSSFNLGSRLQDATKRGELDVIIRGDEEKDLDERFKPSPVNAISDVSRNYADRFAMTERGNELANELAEIESEAQERYAKEYYLSPEYKELARRYTGDQLVQKINEEFNEKYGDKINTDLKPYRDAYYDQLYTRYGQKIREEEIPFIKTSLAKQIEDLKSSVENDINSFKSDLQDVPGAAFIPGTARAAAGRYGNADNKAKQDAYTSLIAAQDLIEKSGDIVKEAGNKGSTSFVAGAIRGFADKAFDIDNWSMGITDTAYNSLLLKAVEKEENGESLTPEESKLLDAAAVNLAVNAYFGSDLGRGYKAGSVTAESIPFMLEIAFNPVSGSGNAIAKAVLKHGMKRYGLKLAGKASGKALKVGARLVGDAVAASGIVGTTGLGHVSAGTTERMIGNIKTEPDDFGKFSYNGRENQKDIGESAVRALASTFFEYQSEMMGNVFAPALKSVGKALKEIPGLGRLSASGIGKLYRGITNNQQLKRIANKTQFHGAIVEYAEEVYNNLMNVTIGEMSMEEFTDLDQNIDTFLGVSLMSTVLGGVGVAGLARESYITQRNINRFEKSLSEDERARWIEVKRQVKDGNIEDAREFIKITLADKSLSPEEKKEEIQYMTDLLKESAIESVHSERANEQIEQDDAEIDRDSNRETGEYVEASIIDPITKEATVGNIVGGSMTDEKSYVIWKPKGGNPRMIQKSEIDPQSIQSLPTSEMKEVNAEMAREGTKADAERMAKYSPDIAEPTLNSTFELDGKPYTIVQKSSEGLLVETADSNGEPAVIPMSEQEYYDAMQAEIDAIENSKMVDSNRENEGLHTDRQNNVSDKDVILPPELPAETQSQEANAGNEANEIPTDEKGNVLYHRVPVDRTIEDLNDGTLEPEEVDGLVAANKLEAEKMLKKYQNNPPSIGTNKAKYLEEKKIWQGKIDDAQSQVDYWNGVSSRLSELRQNPGDEVAEEITSMGEPMNGHELAAMMLANGSIKLLRDSYQNETGFGAIESRSMFGLFASRGKGGLSIEEAGEQLMLADLENGTNLFDQNDPNAGRNAIIDVLSSSRTRGDLISYIKKNREVMAARERRAEFEAYEKWVYDNLGMSVEELAYEESITERTAEKYRDVSELGGLSAIFADTNEQDYERDRSNDEGRISGIQQGSSELLSGERTIYEGANEERTGQSTENAGIINESNDSVQTVSETPGSEDVGVPFKYKTDKGELSLVFYDKKNPNGFYFVDENGLGMYDSDVAKTWGKPTKKNYEKKLREYIESDPIRKRTIENNASFMSKPGNDARFQTEQTDDLEAANERFKPISQKKIDQLIDRLKQTGLAKDVVTDKQKMHEALERHLGNRFQRKSFGGNSGYVGYSMSKRAKDARNNGRFPKTDFKKEYDITETSLKMLVKEGIINDSEWHHTSSYGNRTTFYSWGSDYVENEDGTWEDASYYPVYRSNKKEIDKISKELEVARKAADVVNYNPQSEEYKLYEEKRKEASDILNSIFWNEKSNGVPVSEVQIQSGDVSDLKEKQLSMAMKYNPAPNDYNTWIRNISDILTAQEAFGVTLNGEFEDAMYPDFTANDMRNALEKGEVTVYSRYPIENGVFVTPSYMSAKDYAGDGKVYSKTVKITDVAWIDESEGQYTPVRFMSTPKGEVYGFVTPDGTVYLDPDKLNANTPIHEFGHLWNSFTKENNPELYARGAELIKQSLYWQAVNANPAYSGLSEEGKIDEALAMAIGDKGEAMVQSGDILGIAEVKNWLREVWNWIKNKFGIDAKSDIENLTLEEFTKNAVRELISGSNLSEKGAENDGVPTEKIQQNVTEKPSETQMDGPQDYDFDVTGITEENAQEMKAIKERAQADGTFMKAPNGKPSKLNERQWLQVRTGKFKDWFGDWEKAARIEKLRESKPVEITGEEITPSEDLKEYRNNAKNYGKSHLRGTYTNKDSGVKIEVVANSIDEVASHNLSKEQLQSIAAIPQIIENSIYIDTLPNEDKKRADIKEFDYYVVGLKIGGVDYTVKAVIANSANGERYYDHSLTQIEKRKLLEEINQQGVVSNASSGLSSTGEAGKTQQSRPATIERGTTSFPVSKYKDKRLISILQTNSSRVVDENGEPLVVYHGSKHAKDIFYEFNTQGGSGSTNNTGAWFTSNKDNAETYARHIPTYGVFLNIQNPRTADFHGRYWNEYKPSGYYVRHPNGKEERYKTKKEAKHNMHKGDTLIPEYYKSDTTNEIARNASRSKYDGVIMFNVRDAAIYTSNKIIDGNNYVAFSSSQIKSATDNNGNFDSEQGDIRFQFIDEQPQNEKPIIRESESILDFAQRMSDWNLENSRKNDIFAEKNKENDNDSRTKEHSELGKLVEGQRKSDAISEAVRQASRNLGRSGGTTAETGQSSRANEHFLGQLEVAARQNGAWIDNILEIANERPISHGQENEVFLSKDGKRVIKLNNLSLSEGNFQKFISRLNAHNQSFPDVAYRIAGFAENRNGEFCVVLEQPYVMAEREATPEEIDEYLENHGFYTDISGNWTNGNFEIWDAIPRNVLVDTDGNLRFIDTVVNDLREGKVDNVESINQEIKNEEVKVNDKPSDAQKEAGNYKKGHVNIQGFNITIEQPKGSIRSGIDENGHEWSQLMNNTYGYIRGTESRDGDHIDMFLGNNPNSTKVFVVDQINPNTGVFDEHKVMIGFNSLEEARESYLSNYEDGWKGLGNITETDISSFKKWAKMDGRRIKPFADYSFMKQTQTAEIDNNKLSEPAVSFNSAQLQINWDSPLDHVSNLGVDDELNKIRKEVGYNNDQEDSVTYSERQLTEQGHLTFAGDKLTGAAKIKSSADVAFLFKNLESAATENAFAVLIKEDSTYSVLYLSTGSTNSTTADLKLIAAAANELSAKQVVFVHNHPSGNLRPSRADYETHHNISTLFPGTDIEVLPSIIINLDSGKYSTFEFGAYAEERSKEAPKKTIEPKIYQFDRQVLYVPSAEKRKVSQAGDVAEFLSIQKRGIVPKIQLMILGTDNSINKYVALDPNLDIKELIGRIIYETGKHGDQVILSSNGFVDESKSKLIKNELKGSGIQLLDVLTIKQDQNIIDNYRSFANEGVLEPGATYENRVEDSSGDKKPSDGTIEAYEKELKKEGFKAKEAFQDSMLALKVLQDIIEKTSGNKIKSFENAYMAENQMSSRNLAEAEKYGKEYFKPLIKEIGNLMNTGVDYHYIVYYMMAKHGLERNESMSRREADKWLNEQMNLINKRLSKKEITQDEFANLEAKLKTTAGKLYQKNLQRDYSGLTGLLDKMVDEGNSYYAKFAESGDFTAFAMEFVRRFEIRHDTSALWEKTNAATKETLRKAYESGLMSKDTYEYVSEMYQYYIPLRGWSETTADEVYEYLTSGVSPVSSILKKTKGRSSLADDPIATIGNMAESSILQGNRNLMKQYFLNMAINHPSDLVTIREVWYENRGTVDDPKWVASFPDIPDNATSEQVLQAVSEHEKLMNQLQSEGRAAKKTSGLNIDYKINPRQMNEHVVLVKRNGKDYVIFVNGNPRAAQALNGLTNPDIEENRLLRGISAFNRQLAANFTTRNPAFVFSNLSRDLIYSSSAVLVKENPIYAAHFISNVPKAMATVARGLKGKFDPNNPDDVLFKEFIENGGETGYTALHNVDKYKKMVEKDLNKITGKTDYFKYVRICAESFSAMNRWAEDTSRFNAYMTSRKEGRTITESIHDAKEITVNFNKKGAGYKTSGIFGASSGVLRGFYLFFNAGVQGLANFGKLYNKNKTGFYTLLGGFATAGFMQPMLNSWLISMFGDGDDNDNDYYNLSEWTRRNHLCLYKGNGQFITIPLPIELRAFFGLGEMAMQEITGKTGKKGSEIAYDALNQITELLPINPLGNNGDIVSTIMPDALKPLWQINQNKDFTGQPIYRESSFNEDSPEWTKTYNGTSGWLVDLSEWTNELAGGDKYKRADTMEPVMNWNPAKVEHLFEAYFGGMATTINNTGKTAWYGTKSIIEGEKDDNLIMRNVPVLSRFLKSIDSRSEYYQINNKYYRYFEEYDDTKRELNGYKKEASMGKLDYVKKLYNLQKSDSFKRYKIFESYKKEIDKISKLERRILEMDDSKSKKLRNEMAELKKSLIKELEKIDN